VTCFIEPGRPFQEPTVESPSDRAESCPFGRGWSGVRMPLLRYFLYVGGALLLFLLISSSVLPQVPLPSALTSRSDLPPVRIRSERKLPEQVVFDTSSTVSLAPIPVIAAASVARTVAPVAEAVTAAAATAPEISPKARVREAFAQLPEDKLILKSLPKRKVAKPRTAQPFVLVAQQPHFVPLNTW